MLVTYPERGLLDSGASVEGSSRFRCVPKRRVSAEGKGGDGRIPTPTRIAGRAVKLERMVSGSDLDSFLAQGSLLFFGWGCVGG